MQSNSLFRLIYLNSIKKYISLKLLLQILCKIWNAFSFIFMFLIHIQFNDIYLFNLNCFIIYIILLSQSRLYAITSTRFMSLLNPIYTSIYTSSLTHSYPTSTTSQSFSVPNKNSHGYRITNKKNSPRFCQRTQL